MYPIPVDVLDGALDYAAIGISALAALVTAAALWVAIWQARASREDARVARAAEARAQAEVAELQRTAVAQEAAHQRALLAIEGQSYAREAARRWNVENVRLRAKWASEDLGHFFDVNWSFRNPGDTIASNLRIYLAPPLQPSPNNLDLRQPIVSVPHVGPRQSPSATVRVYVPSEPPETPPLIAYFHDEGGNHWRLTTEGALDLTRPRHIGVSEQSHPEPPKPGD